MKSFTKYIVFPDTLSISVVGSESQKPIGGVVVRLQLQASYRGDYFWSMITDSSGTASVTIGEMRKSILEDRSTFLMDYSSELEECSAEILVYLLSAEEVARKVSGMEVWMNAVNTDPEYIRKFKDSINGDYEPAVVTAILDEPCASRSIIIYAKPSR